MLSRADDVEGVRIAVEMVGDYKTFFDQTGLSQGGGGAVGNMAGGTGGETKSLEDLFYAKEMEMAKLAFTRQFTHSIVYAWVKLREQVRLVILFVEIVRGKLTVWAGNTEHHVDCRVHCAEPERQDKQLHQRVLNVVWTCETCVYSCMEFWW